MSHRANLKWNFSKSQREGQVLEHEPLASSFPEAEPEPEQPEAFVVIKALQKARPKISEAVIEAIQDRESDLTQMSWWEVEAILRLAHRLQALADEFKCETYIGTIGQASCSLHATLRESCAYVSRWEAPPPISVPEPAPQPHRCYYMVSCSAGCGRMHKIFPDEAQS